MPLPSPTDDADLNPDDGANHPLTPAQIASRIRASTSHSSLVLSSSLSVTFASLTQRGYYPDDLEKANQDALCILPQFHNDAKQLFMAVFDGHGNTGDKCAIFVRANLPTQLTTCLSKGLSMSQAYTKAFTDTNEQLHVSSHINDTMSGTTAIAVTLEGNTVHVANVGDSRAIIARRDTATTELKAYPLSIDQTPFRLDERTRVKKCGARVMTLDQIEGLEPIHENWGLQLGKEVDEDGDPPRIWSPHGNYPGTAFTRSLGDAKAETLGVFAEPEVLSFDLTPEDEYIVIASDGVFEFITSQSVVDMIKVIPSIEDACKAVVAEAYRLWLQYEVRTDDITIIICKLSIQGSMHQSTIHPNHPPPTSIPGLAGTASNHMERPVRQYKSRAKNRAQLTLDLSKVVTPEDLAYDLVKNGKVKTIDEVLRMKKVVQHNMMLHHLSFRERADLFHVMMPIVVAKDQVVIAQGDEGLQFFCVESGDYCVKVSSVGNDGVETEAVVHTYHGSSHPSFGELAVMHRAPRSASVVANTEGGKLWAIDCRAFRKIVMKSSNQNLIKTLQQVDILHALSNSQLLQLLDVLTEITFDTNEVILTQGEVGERFFVVESGKVVCTINQPVGPPKLVLELGPNDYFGERALLNKAPRAANVYATMPTKVLAMDRSEFETILGPLQDLINTETLKKEVKAAFKQLVTDSSRERTESNDSAPGDWIEVPAVKTIPAPKNCVTFGELCKTALGKMSLVAWTQSKGKGDIVTTVTAKLFSKITCATAEMQQVVQHEKQHYELLNALASPYLPSLLGFWQDTEDLVLLTDRCMLADVATMMVEAQVETLPLDHVRILLAQTLLGLESLHESGTVYRNLNPEHLAIDTSGHVQLHDFRYAKLIGRQKTLTLCGSPEGMAPEMIDGRGHDFSVDYWALGILLHELLLGASPFAMSDTASHMDIYANIRRYEPRSLRFPLEWSLEDTKFTHVKDLMHRLIHPIVSERLGCDGSVDVNTGGSPMRAHPFFGTIDWVAIASGNGPTLLSTWGQAKLEHLISQPGHAMMAETNDFEGF